MNAKNTYYEMDTQTGQNRLRFQGDWVVDNAETITASLKQSNFSDIAAIDASAIGKIDSWGAIQLKRVLTDHGVPTTLTTQQKRIFDFLQDETPAPAKKQSQPLLYSIFVTVGERAVAGFETAYGLMAFIGRIAACFSKNILHPKSFRFHSIVRHIQETGLQALPIIGLLAILITMVIAYQAATQLEKFGANIFTVDLTVISLLREMAVLVTAIMVAGRSGSAFAAEIGVMKLREEIDAMRTMGLDPIEVLVLPRLIALIITLPLLTFLADIIGLIGAGMISTLLLDIPLDQYIDRVQSVAKPMMFFVGMIKAPVFAFIIAIVGTYQGMNVTGSAESVGKLTTVSVVQSIFLVILMDAFFSILFANLGI